MPTYSERIVLPFDMRILHIEDARHRAVCLGKGGMLPVEVRATECRHEKLLRTAEMKKAELLFGLFRSSCIRMSQDIRINLVAGTGFEPVTFGL